ncbi:hypothetical protein CYLTODRAFT_418101 [Cylindrobasidium torrendii FP15055 ss-10]|uniref:RING-type domain-containing protein n=1 Tax=Cylindrobasidium torrendii FP15055 ss-10 TaxID=1314674 RepID=A0A0D7BRT7_9AGAR|nr:hypothetical protein CYLTODRAFT_418101 [Cylindrobasidium torrendii FP15055 ss-10]
MVRPRWNLKAARISSPLGTREGLLGYCLSSTFPQPRRYPLALTLLIPLMPIQLSSASVCDVCYEPFNISANARKAPHSIPCGHVFCKSCLSTLSQCPSCRRQFEQGQVRRLHVSGGRTIQSDALVSRALHALDSTGKDMQSDIIQAIEDAEHRGEDMSAVRGTLDLWTSGRGQEERARTDALRTQLKELVATAFVSQYDASPAVADTARDSHREAGAGLLSPRQLQVVLGAILRSTL